MNLKEYIKEGKVKRIKKDTSLIKSLLEMSQETQEGITYIPLNEKTAATIFTQHYESLRQIIEALAIQEGYKVLSHEALTAFLQEHGENEIAGTFDRARRIRNGINYYGRKISTEEVTYTAPRIQQAIKPLRKRIKQ